jgi:hypothetical protein
LINVTLAKADVCISSRMVNTSRQGAEITLPILIKCLRGKQMIENLSSPFYQESQLWSYLQYQRKALAVGKGVIL